MRKGLWIYQCVAFYLILLSNVSTAHAGTMGKNSNSHQVEFYISGGPAFSTLRNEKYITINSFVVNSYNTQVKTNWQGLWGGGIGYYSSANLFHTPLSLSVGVAGYGINMGNVNGIEFPFINDDIYDTLNYQFTVKTSAVLAEARLFYSNYSLQPFVLAGIGSAWNNLSNYFEVPTVTSLSAAPVLTQFGNHTNNAFTYEFGLGVQHSIYQPLFHHINLTGSIDYRYISFGKGQLTNLPAQTTGEGLMINNIHIQAIMFTLKASV